jgi:hypothetical protein
MIIKKFYTQLILSSILLSTAVAAVAALCPALNSINRPENQYQWFTASSNWDGFFMTPELGKGTSYYVTHFLRAEWVKLYDAPNSPGYIQCQYQGNNAGEIIKFVQHNAQSTKMPHAIGWACNHLDNYPGVACTCSSGSAEGCAF